MAQYYPKHEVPAYKMICVDEGQDFHLADYQMIRRLYPQAQMNVFGDTMQALHEECGVSDWKQATGIETIHHLDVNYRNRPEIVAFCNQKFGCDMGFVGRVEPKSIPKVYTRAADIVINLTTNTPLIVRGREELALFCRQTGTSMDRFDYIDTRSEQTAPDKVPCYSVFAAKGLEFPAAAVFAYGMNRNQKIVACTRAMNNLYYCE